MPLMSGPESEASKMIEVHRRDDEVNGDREPVFDLFVDGHLLLDSQVFPYPNLNVTEAERKWESFVLRSSGSSGCNKLLDREHGEFGPEILGIHAVQLFEWLDTAHQFTFGFNDHPYFSERANTVELGLWFDGELWKHPWSVTEYRTELERSFEAEGDFTCNFVKEQRSFFARIQVEPFLYTDILLDRLVPLEDMFRRVHERAISALQHRVNDGSSADVYVRIYVSDERYQAEQIKAFIRLFESYLNRIEQWPVRVDALRSGKGTSFVFKVPKGSDSTRTPVLRTTITTFEAFMELCRNNAVEAERLMNKIGTPTDQSADWVMKYTKDYVRLKLEWRQEFERRRQQFYHALETIEQELQLSGNFAEAEVVLEGSLTTGTLFGSGRDSVTVNINTTEQNQAKIEALKEQFFGSGIVYTPEEQEVIRLIRENVTNEEEVITLVAELDQGKDETAEPEVRRSAWQRLKAGIQRNAPTIADAAFRATVDLIIKGMGGH